MSRCVAALIVLVASTAAADGVRAHATKKTGPISIDGKLDEAAWAAAPAQQGFTQRSPKDGAKAVMDTKFAIVFDDKAVYIGVWAFDPDPSKIRALLTRRDVQSPSDVVLVAIDSYRDRRTAYTFQLNAAGVQRDTLLYDDSQEDATWDAVWTGDVAITKEGWTAEMRIPFSQLRFSDDAPEWGFQVMRNVARTNEQTTWSPWPRTGPEIVSRFGFVDGMAAKHGPRLEILPYATGGFDVNPIDEADPFDERVVGRGGAGVDIKYGLSSAFTLSATINPDFGQVEADPSQINLSGNELFFAEKRPFFLEGVDLFRLGIGNSDVPIEGQFYSRRIGAAPADPDVDYDYIDAPKSTTIYGAAKLTGKTRSGLSLGVLDAVTGDEQASIADVNGTHEMDVAPLTNYAVGRVKQDFRNGRTSFGLSATAVNRDLSDDYLKSELHDQAYTAGAQIEHRWGAWIAKLNAVTSYVHGSEDAIAITQQKQLHLYQRPDATNAHFDPTRTSLAGYGLNWLVGPTGETKHWNFSFGGDLRSIGLDMNDVGFQTVSDRAIPFLAVNYHDHDPGDTVLDWNAHFDVFTVSTLEPTLTDYGAEYNAWVQLANYWSFAAGGSTDVGIVEPSALRGGPSLNTDTQTSVFANMMTDSRFPVQVFFNVSGARNRVSDATAAGVDLGLTIQARSNIDLYLGPSFSSRTDRLQYVDQVDDSFGTRHYVFGKIDQMTGSLTVRLNWTFSPRLTLQAYAQPFIASGRYSELKDVDHPGANKFEDRFTNIEGNAYSLADDTYTVRAGTGAMYSFDKPDFNVRELRSTVVMRWEYRPGSSIFAIWSHGQSDSIVDGRFRFGDSVRALADAAGENTFMVKANYWIGL
ncbi:MAG TPA: DUF5916 domain-containing protein [Kofleriaceae bacterium]|jgi:hypothetical protein